MQIIDHCRVFLYISKQVLRGFLNMLLMLFELITYFILSAGSNNWNINFQVISFYGLQHWITWKIQNILCIIFETFFSNLAWPDSLKNICEFKLCLTTGICDDGLASLHGDDEVMSGVALMSSEICSFHLRFSSRKNYLRGTSYNNSFLCYEVMIQLVVFLRILYCSHVCVEL